MESQRVIQQLVICTSGMVRIMDFQAGYSMLTRMLVWHGTQEKYQIFDTLGGRFNSEFGMEAFPHIQTIKEFVTDESELYPQSHTLDFHNKGKPVIS